MLGKHEQALVDVVAQILTKTDLGALDPNVEYKLGDALRRSWLLLYREYTALAALDAGRGKEVEPREKPA